MKIVTVREVRQDFSRKVEAPLRRGETLVLRKRDKVLGWIVPEPSKLKPYPDFAAMQKEIFGDWTFDFSAAEILRKHRDRL
jgi:antitoxin (DNA-binding transcriptional repressor) of toxin-antitoxin stability system